MWKKTQMGCVLLLLLILPMTAFGAIESVLVPGQFAKLYNEALVSVFPQVMKIQARGDMFKSIMDTVSLTTQDTVSPILYLDSDMSLVEAQFLFGSGNPALDRQSSQMSLAVSTRMNSRMRDLACSAFLEALCTAEPSLSKTRLRRWMDSVSGPSDTLSVKGYQMSYLNYEGYEHFSLIPEKGSGSDRSSSSGRDSLPPQSSSKDSVKSAGKDNLPPQGTVLLSDNQMTIVCQKTELLETDNTVYLEFMCEIDNRTSKKQNIFVDEVTINGVRGYGIGIMYVEPGKRTDKLILMPEEKWQGKNTPSAREIRSARDVKITLRIQQDDDYKVMYKVPVQMKMKNGSLLSASGQKAVRPTPTPKKTSKPRATPTPRKTVRPTATPRKTARPTATPRRTARPTATPRRSARATATPARRDTSCPLDIPDGARGEWKYLSGNRLNMRVKLTNTSRKVVKAYEVYMYATDVWGKKIYGNTVYYATTRRKIQPGKSAFTNYMTLPDRSNIGQVWVGVNKVLYEDGSVWQASKVDYRYWDIN